MFSKVILFWLLLGTKVLSFNYSQYVDLFIGTQGTVPGTSFNGGNVFPGASLPFGAVKVGIDTTELVS
jgi:putative alpha-1,2-mannosidase